MRTPNESPTPVPARGALADQAVRRVADTLSATLSADDLVAVAGGRARVELRLVGPERPDPAQLGLYTEPLPVVVPAAPAPAVRARRAPATPVPVHDHGVDIAATIARIDELATPAAVEQYLRDPSFSLPVLKQVARALGPTVLATGRSKTEVRRDIVAGTVGFRSRSAAMSGGAWS